MNYRRKGLEKTSGLRSNTDYMDTDYAVFTVLHRGLNCFRNSNRAPKCIGDRGETKCLTLYVDEGLFYFHPDSKNPLGRESPHEGPYPGYYCIRRPIIISLIPSLSRSCYKKMLGIMMIFNSSFS